LMLNGLDTIISAMNDLNKSVNKCNKYDQLIDTLPAEANQAAVPSKMGLVRGNYWMVASSRSNDPESLAKYVDTIIHSMLSDQAVKISIGESRNFSSCCLSNDGGDGGQRN